MHDVCCVYEVQYLVHALYQSDSSCVGVFQVFSVLYVQYVYVLYIRTFVCCVHFGETVAHTSACSCRVFTLL